MPIRFQCGQCGQHLSIARRKSGTQVDCPRCGLNQTVPGEPVLVEPISAEATADEPVADEPSERIDAAVEEDHSQVESDAAEPQPSFEWELSPSEPPPFPEGINLTDTIDLMLPLKVPPIVAAKGPPPPPVARQADNQPPETCPRTPIPWAIYGQALFLLVVAGGAFLAGYYLGRQDGPITTAASSEPETPSETDVDSEGNPFSAEEVLLEVRLRWTPNVNESSGDQGALFVALPQKSIPRSALPVAGLRADDAGSPESQASIAALRSAGGAFSLAEADGTVAAVLPREGQYYLLMVSKHVLRPTAQPVRQSDLVAMKQYFAEPEKLIGQSSYVWRSQEIRVGTPAIEHDFGLDGL